MADDWNGSGPTGRRAWRRTPRTSSATCCASSSRATPSIDPAKLASAAGLPERPGDGAAPDRPAAAGAAEQRRRHQLGPRARAGQGPRGAAQRSESPPAERSRLEQALHVASLWLDEVDRHRRSCTVEPELLTRAGWVEATMPVWTQLAEPVATSIADSLTGVLEEQAPEELHGMIGNARPDHAQRRRHAVRDAARPGRRPARRARSSRAATSASRCSTTSTQAALVAQNVDAFGAGLDIPIDQVRALPRGARARPRAAVPAREVAAAAPLTAITDVRARHPHRHRPPRGARGRTSTRRTPKSCARP